MNELEDIKAAFLRGETRALEGDPIQVADDYNSTGRELFWMDKNLPATRACLEAGIRFCQAHAGKEEVLGKEKAMNYNLGSFCWPGWGEEGIAPTEDDVRAGQAAANRNLELGTALKRGPGPMANAHWLVGAYHLHFDRRREASESFTTGEQLAEDAAAKVLMKAYRELSEYDDKGFEATCKVMQEVGGEDTEFYIHQLQTAWWIYNFSDEAA